MIIFLHSVEDPSVTQEFKIDIPDEGNTTEEWVAGVIEEFRGYHPRPDDWVIDMITFGSGWIVYLPGFDSDTLETVQAMYMRAQKAKQNIIPYLVMGG